MTTMAKLERELAALERAPDPLGQMERERAEREQRAAALRAALEAQRARDAHEALLAELRELATEAQSHEQAKAEALAAAEAALSGFVEQMLEAITQQADSRSRFLQLAGADACALAGELEAEGADLTAIRAPLVGTREGPPGFDQAEQASDGPHAAALGVALSAAYHERRAAENAESRHNRTRMAQERRSPADPAPSPDAEAGAV